MIRVEKISETYLRIYADKSIEQEISEEFTFTVPGAKWTPKYKSGQWDGKIRLFNQNTKTLYAGLYLKLHRWAKENGYKIEYVENDIYSKPFYKDEISLEDIEKFVDDLNIHSSDEELETRDYQLEAIYNAIKYRRLTLISPTASGKSFIIYCILRWVLEYDRKCLLIVPTTSLVEQMYKDFIDYSSHNEFDVEENAQILYSGKSKKLTSNIMITTWQSIQDMPKEFFHQFTVIIGDEGHTFKATKLTGIMERCVVGDFRIATTGTLDGSAVNELVIQGLFGPIYNVISTKELMDQKYVSQLEIKCMLMNWPQDVAKATRKLKYKEEYDFLCTHPGRNKYIAKIAQKTQGNTLILFNYVDKQGKPLYELMKNMEGKKVYFLHGGVDVDERERVRAEVANINNAVIIASYGIYSTGINVPSIEHIILAAPVKSRIRILQSIGRGLRLAMGKIKCTLWDIGDNLKYKNGKNNTTLNHFISRIELYESQQFGYKIIEVNIG